MRHRANRRVNIPCEVARLTSGFQLHHTTDRQMKEVVSGTVADKLRVPLWQQSSRWLVSKKLLHGYSQHSNSLFCYKNGIRFYLKF